MSRSSWGTTAQPKFIHDEVGFYVQVISPLYAGNVLLTLRTQANVRSLVLRQIPLPLY